MKLQHIALLLIFSILVIGCPNNQGFIGSDSSEEATSIGIENLVYEAEEDLSNLNSFIDQIKSKTDTSTNDFEVGVRVKLADAIGEIFNNSTHPCGELPKKILKKLTKTSDGGWLPLDIEAQLERTSGTARKLMGNAPKVLLHSAAYQKQNGEKGVVIMAGGPTYRDFNITDYIDADGYGSFAYTLDCSGYLSAAINASGGIPKGTEVKAYAKSNRTSDKSLLVSRATCYSPLLLAVRPGTYSLNVTWSDSMRLEVLNSILAAFPPAEENTTTVNLSSTYDIMWATKKGESGFNGEAGIKGEAGISVPGLVKVNFSGASRGSMTVGVSFTDYDSYLLREKEITAYRTLTIGEVRAAKSELEKKLSNIASL